jgi:hypothetical protein
MKDAAEKERFAQKKEKSQEAAMDWGAVGTNFFFDETCVK